MTAFYGKNIPCSHTFGSSSNYTFNALKRFAGIDGNPIIVRPCSIVTITTDNCASIFNSTSMYFRISSYQYRVVVGFHITIASKHISNFKGTACNRDFIPIGTSRRSRSSIQISDFTVSTALKFHLVVISIAVEAYASIKPCIGFTDNRPIAGYFQLVAGNPVVARSAINSQAIIEIVFL